MSQKPLVLFLHPLRYTNTCGIILPHSKAHIRYVDSFYYLKVVSWASLVVQWLRICLPMQGTRVRALVQEDPTCRVASKPVGYNRACALEPAGHGC